MDQQATHAMAPNENPSNSLENPRAQGLGIKGSHWENLVQSSTSHCGGSTYLLPLLRETYLLKIDTIESNSTEGSFLSEFSDWVRRQKRNSETVSDSDDNNSRNLDAKMESDRKERQSRKKERTSPRFKTDKPTTSDPSESEQAVKDRDYSSAKRKRTENILAGEKATG